MPLHIQISCGLIPRCVEAIAQTERPSSKNSGLTLALYRKAVKWMERINGLWISHLLAVGLLQDGLKLVPREECIAESISKNMACLPGKSFRFWPFYIKLPWHTDRRLSSNEKEHRLLHSAFDWKIWSLQFSSKLGHRQQKHRRQAETNKAMWKLMKRVRFSQQTKQLFIQWKDIW